MLSVIIVNYNVKYYLEQCLESVRRASSGLQVEVFVVDNLSTDGSVAYLRERFPEVTFVENTENKGFARANNQAIRLSKGRYVLLLNPDTIITEHTLFDFVNFMDEHPEAGGVGAYMLRTDGTFAPESRRGLPTPFVAFCKMSGLASLFPHSRLFGRYYMRYLDEDEINEIEIISGACMFLRREAIDKVGLLDEDFFMYGEDIDLSYRILKGGYKNYFLPTCVLHYKGESTEKSSFRYTYTFYQAMRLFFRKHYAHYSFLVSLPINIVIWVRSFMAYVGNQFKHRKRRQPNLQNTNMLVIGDAQMLAEVKKLVEKLRLPGNVSFVEGRGDTFPCGHMDSSLDITGYDMVVYSPEAYTYDIMLRMLKDTPGNTLRLATYSTRSKVLITENAFYV